MSLLNKKFLNYVFTIDDLKKEQKEKKQSLSEFTVGGLEKWSSVYEYLLTKHDNKINQLTRELVRL